jgi:arsenate reductase-like glutaredoxin family protein
VPQVTVYEKSTRTTCRKLARLLEERGIDFERVNYHVDPLPEAPTEHFSTLWWGQVFSRSFKAA